MTQTGDSDMNLPGSGKNSAEKQQRQKNTRIFAAVVAVICLIAFFAGKNTGSEKTADTALPDYSGKAASLVTVEGGPESGVISRTYESNPATLHIVNGTTADVFAKCADGLFNKSVISFYLRAGEELTISVPVGYFELHLASGEKWESESDLFGESTLYFTDTTGNGLEFGRKKVCEFTVEPGFANMKQLQKNRF